jgi:hypothetical protein
MLYAVIFPSGVPVSAKGMKLAPETKSRPRRLLNSNPMIVDQAALNAGFDLRR